MRLEAKGILITGGGWGIGLELARRLANPNEVVIAGRDHARLDRAAAQARALRRLRLDVTSERQAALRLPGGAAGPGGDQPVSQAVARAVQGTRAPEADHRGRTMPAKFPGHCRKCGGTIEVGDPTRFYAAAGGRQAEVAHGVCRRRRPSTASPRPALTAGTPRTSNRGAAPTATSGGRRGWGEEGGPGGTTLGRSRLATRRAVRPRRGTGPRRLDVAGRPRLEAAPLRTPASNAHPGGGASRASSEGRLQSLRARGFRQRGGHTTRESQHEDRKRDQEREHAGASEREDLQRGAGGAFERIEVARALGVDAHGLLLRLGLGLRCRPLGLKLRRTHERPGRPARLYLPRRRRLPPERE